MGTDGDRGFKVSLGISNNHRLSKGDLGELPAGLIKKAARGFAAFTSAFIMWAVVDSVEMTVVRRDLGPHSVMNSIQVSLAHQSAGDVALVRHNEQACIQFGEELKALESAR